MNLYSSIIRIAATLVVLIFSTTVFAGEAMNQLRGPIEQVIEILKDPNYKAPDKKQEQREKIFAITNQAFDFIEMSKRSLGKNWRTFTPEQRKNFTDVFADHLNNTYMDKVQNQYQDETVEFIDEEKLGDDKAVVKSFIKRRSVNVPVDYSMILVDKRWRVYDVNIEGVSLIKNYRSQFDELLAKETPEQVIERLRKKTDIQDLKN